MQLVKLDEFLRSGVEAERGSLTAIRILLKLRVIFSASIGLINLAFVCSVTLFIYAFFRYIFNNSLSSAEIYLITIFSTLFFFLMLYLRALVANIVWEIWSNDRDMHDTY